MTGEVLTLNCDNCHAPLPYSPNQRVIKCPYCNAENIIKSFNAEVAAKENINSGFPLCCAPETLHGRLVGYFYNAQYIPLDLFDEAEVIREEKFYIPGYCFYCNGSLSYTYEVGVDRTVMDTQGRGSNKQIVSRNIVEWTPNSSIVSASETVFASGNREMKEQVAKLYEKYNVNKLVDVEQLHFPSDATTPVYDYPEASSFSETAVPLMNELLKNQAAQNISKQRTRNFTAGGSYIQKETKRVLLGAYRVVYSYGGQECSMWVSGDGSEAYIYGVPEDTARKEKFFEMKRQHAELEKSHKKAFAIMVLLTIITLGIYLIASRALQDNKDRKEELAESKQELTAFEAEWANVKNRFAMSNSPLKGIYRR